jgi:hypothetical protein
MSDDRAEVIRKIAAVIRLHTGAEPDEAMLDEIERLVFDHAEAAASSYD